MTRSQTDSVIESRERSDGLLALDPLISDRAASLLSQTSLLFELTDALGSPLSLVLPDQVTENVGRFAAVMGNHGLDGDILFAHKANRSSALVRRLATTAAGIDVASLAELQHAVGAGFAPERILAGGPKNEAFIWLAVQLGVPISVDSVNELRMIAALPATGRSSQTQITLRLSDFDAPGALVRSRPSRFGICYRDLDTAIAIVTEHRDSLVLTGVAFHLDTVAISEKVVAIDACVRALDRCRAAGHDPRNLDIGGGYKSNYLRDANQWEQYTGALRASVMGQHAPLTWGGDGMGLRNQSGTLSGSLAVYNFWDSLTADAYLDRLLSEIAPSFGRPVASVLLENMYRLQIEPGRALLDQSGVTVSRVLDRWTTPQGDTLVRLDMNRHDLSDTELLVDPVLVPSSNDSSRSPTPSAGVYFVGNLCMESDFITRRKVFLPRCPDIDDLVVFTNTAGYFMDFGANHALQQPIARKVALWEDGNRWRWSLDDEYWPTHRNGENRTR